METIELDNNIILKTRDNTDKNINNITDITELNLFKIIKQKKLFLRIDFNKLNKRQYKKILRKLLLIKNIIKKTNIQIGIKENSKILIGLVLNYDKKNKDHKDFIYGINAIFFNTRYERYNYIYDTVCTYLDTYFYGKNLCDFKDNKCGAKINTTSNIGCCRHYKNRILGPFKFNNKLVKCEYLQNYRCSAKCLPCKLFTCDYLEKKGIKFKIKDIFLLDTFFNPIQKITLKFAVYTTKDVIIKRLILKSYLWI